MFSFFDYSSVEGNDTHLGAPTMFSKGALGGQNPKQVMKKADFAIVLFWLEGQVGVELPAAAYLLPILLPLTKTNFVSNILPSKMWNK